jgi:nucleoside-diphosphate-sugar epimerase
VASAPSSIGERCLVTGGGGFIGSTLAVALCRAGWGVRVLDDFSTGRRPNLDDVAGDVEIVDGDLRDPAAVRAAVGGVEVVFHQGAVASVARSIEDPWTSHEVNVSGTLHILLAARDEGVRRVVVASSAAVYGNAAPPPLHERLVPRPASPYGVTKLAAERYAEAFTRTWDLPTVSLRYLNVFGPRQDPASSYASAIPTFITRTLADLAPTVYGDGEQARDFIFVDDVVRANMLAAASPAGASGRAFNIGRGERRTVNEALSTIRSLVPGDHPAPKHAAARLGEIRDSWSDVAAAREALGFEAVVPFDEGLRRTIASFSRDGGTSRRPS